MATKKKRRPAGRPSGNPAPASAAPRPAPAEPSEPAPPVSGPPLPRSVLAASPRQRLAYVELADWAGQLADLERERDRSAVAARRAGLSWSAIGHALGTSGEAARQRFAGRLAP